MCDDAGEGKAGRRVSRGERFSTFPKFTLTASFVRILAVGRSLKEQSDSVRGAHSFQRGPTCVRRIGRPVTGTADRVHQTGGTKLYSNADIGSSDGISLKG